MPLINNNTLPLTLNLLRANLQRPNQTGLLLALSLNSNDLPGVNGVLGIREPAARGCQARSHKGSTGKHEADCAAVDLDCWESCWECVDEAEVRDRGAVEGLEEEGCRVYCVEGCSLGTIPKSAELAFALVVAGFTERLLS